MTVSTIGKAARNSMLMICALAAAASSLRGQDWALSNIEQLQRVDLRYLGYHLVNEIPENSSAVTSLFTASNGKIYGGTTGEEAYFFLFDPSTNKVQHLGRIPGQRTVHHALVEDKNGVIYLGTGVVDMFRPISVSPGGIGENEDNRFLDMFLWEDVRSHFRNSASGHLYRYDPNKSERPSPVQGIFSEDYVVKFVGDDADVEDLGVPVAENMVYALTVSPDGSEIYGLTYPDGHFFVYDIAGGEFHDRGEIDSEIVFHGPERHRRSLPRTLICDDAGRVYTSSAGVLMYYDPRSGKIESTGLKIPGESYPIHRTATYAVVECFARHSNGLIYGGTSDGHLFSFDPRKNRLKNLGKVRADRRLRSLTIGRDGRVYFVAGERPETSPSPCQLYSFDPAQGEFKTLGLLIADRSPHYYWRGYQFDSMTTGEDGTIYLGESERRSHLFLYIPE